MAKERSQSKTYWFNILAGLIATLESQVGLMGQYLGSTTMQVIVVVIVLGNLVIREFTTQPIKRDGDL